MGKGLPKDEQAERWCGLRGKNATKRWCHLNLSFFLFEMKTEPFSPVTWLCWLFRILLEHAWLLGTTEGSHPFLCHSRKPKRCHWGFLEASFAQLNQGWTWWRRSKGLTKRSWILAAMFHGTMNMRSPLTYSLVTLILGWQKETFAQFLNSMTLYSFLLRNILTLFLHILYRYGRVVDLNRIYDKKTGEPRGFAFIAYEDQRSTTLAVDNLNGATVS